MKLRYLKYHLMGYRELRRLTLGMTKEIDYESDPVKRKELIDEYLYALGKLIDKCDDLAFLEAFKRGYERRFGSKKEG